MVRLAGVDRTTIHDLRRSALTNWARVLAAPVVMELAGHSDIKTTLRYYVSIQRSDLDQAREVASDLLLDAKWTQNR